MLAARRAAQRVAASAAAAAAATAVRRMSSGGLPNRLRRLEDLSVSNAQLDELPVDTDDGAYVRTVAGAAFSRVMPTPVDRPRLVALSADALALLDVDAAQVASAAAADPGGRAVALLCGNALPHGAVPAAHVYCGHQFGSFAGQLGDGAAILLGDVVNTRGERWELQLKGAGLTPFSRTADGRKVLRSSLREFLCSEWMHAVGVPTTRAGSVVTSDTRVVRDVFYTGEPVEERASECRGSVCHLPAWRVCTCNRRALGTAPYLAHPTLPNAPPASPAPLRRAARRCSRHHAHRAVVPSLRLVRGVQAARPAVGAGGAVPRSTRCAGGAARVHVAPLLRAAGGTARSGRGGASATCGGRGLGSERIRVGCATGSGRCPHRRLGGGAWTQ